ncbi:MAG: DUF559 domain-containing protein [Candidatus Falkowbacteria bacterium]
MPKSSPQAKKLYNALIRRNIECEKEKWDNHKHIDISIDRAKIYIEIDGDYHYTSSRQIEADFNREYYSSQDGYRTIHIPNSLIDRKLRHVANAIEQVAMDYINKKPNLK